MSIFWHVSNKTFKNNEIVIVFFFNFWKQNPSNRSMGHIYLLSSSCMPETSLKKTFIIQVLLENSDLAIKNSLCKTDRPL